MSLWAAWGERRVDDFVIADPEHHTVIDERGAVHSIQVALITLPEAALEALWEPMYLERLARTYWNFLSRATLGLIRVAYSPGERSVVLLSRPITLLRFGPPEYELERTRGIVRWGIRRGLLVAADGHEGDGYLEIDVRRETCEQPGRARVRVEVEVANFYPAIANWFTRGIYKATQSRVHVLVTHGFLRSLTRLKLERSAVGRFDPQAPGALAQEMTVGHTPWGVIATVFAAVVLWLTRRRWRRPRRSGGD
ncbi:MAG: hypothetical protein M3P40_04420 [Actinomycetota bacterium]|nr:hypothetical protein [Actinomycetota bacterium]